MCKVAKVLINSVFVFVSLIIYLFIGENIY